MKFGRKLEAGFSLIELLVVVAIISVLSTIAMPNYAAVVAKARQVEAKNAASAMYVAEKSFYGEQNSYTYCLYDAGYVPEGSRRYYLTGFWNGAGDGCGSTCWQSDFYSHAGCTTNAPSFSNNATFVFNAWGNSTMQDAGVVGINFSASSNQFNAVALGSIGTAPVFDIWQMTDQRVLTNLQVGY